MKKKLLGLSLITLLCVGKITAQETENDKPSVEKSIKGIQIGDPGIAGYYEFKMTNQLTLRAEAGYSIGYKNADWFFDDGNEDGFFAIPAFTIEPRWYYNLGRRVRKGKDIARNRANYFSVTTTYYADFGVIKIDEVGDVPNFLYVVPMWGMRRTLGKNFDYELGAGIGYQHVGSFEHRGHIHEAKDDAVFLIRARFGLGF